MTPCVVGLAARDDERRKSVKPGVKRSASSTVVAAELRRSAEVTTVVAAGVSTPRSSRRPAVTVTVLGERSRTQHHRDGAARAERGGGDALGGEAGRDDDQPVGRHRIGVEREGAAGVAAADDRPVRRGRMDGRGNGRAGGVGDPAGDADRGGRGDERRGEGLQHQGLTE